MLPRWTLFLSAVLLVLLSLVRQGQAATPTSFCKCTCFKQSYIIALDAPPPSSTKPGSGSSSAHDNSLPRSVPLSSPRYPPLTPRVAAEESNAGSDNSGSDQPGNLKAPYKAKTCNDCNKQFCINLDLPICKDAIDEDVITTCFQRDSAKDEAVVFIFIIATVSLLGWALIKPFAGKWMEQAKERRSYIPIANTQDQ